MAKSTKRDREERERLRRYQARQQVHEQALRARRRDNVVAVVAGVGLIAAATVAQIAYFELGPGSADPVVVEDANDGVDATTPETSDTDEQTLAPVPDADEADSGENAGGDDPVGAEEAPSPVP